MTISQEIFLSAAHKTCCLVEAENTVFTVGFTASFRGS